MSYLILPCWVRQKIDRTRSRFLWENSINHEEETHLVTWDQVCKVKREGGLGVMNLRNFNLVLIANGGGDFCLN